MVLYGKMWRARFVVLDGRMCWAWFVSLREDVVGVVCVFMGRCGECGLWLFTGGCGECGLRFSTGGCGGHGLWFFTGGCGGRGGRGLWFMHGDAF